MKQWKRGGGQHHQEEEEGEQTTGTHLPFASRLANLAFSPSALVGPRGGFCAGLGGACCGGGFENTGIGGAG